MRESGDVISGAGALSERVGVLAGGPSSEREISLRSGRAVHKALVEAGVDAVFLDVTGDISDIIKKSGVGIAFIALHGRFGEDGTVQAMLEELGVPYTGSGVEASRLAIDKIATKDRFVASGIKTPHYAAIRRGEVTRLPEGLGLPLVVKPQFEGSSIGLSVVRSAAEYSAAVEKSLACGGDTLVEEYIDGRELTVGILNDKALPVVEIETKNKIYDYEAKYHDPATRYIVPARLDRATAECTMRLGLEAHRALRCRSFSRVDIMLNAAGELYVLEVNTIPGMTERSLLPKAAGAAGMSFADLCLALIRGAIAPRGAGELSRKTGM